MPTPNNHRQNSIPVRPATNALTGKQKALSPALLRPGCGVLGKGALAAVIAMVNAMLPGHHAMGDDKPKAATSGSIDNQWFHFPDTSMLPEVDVTAKEGYKADSLSLQKYSEPLLTTPQSASVVTPQLMQDQGVTEFARCAAQCLRRQHRRGRGQLPGGQFFHPRVRRALGHLPRWDDRLRQLQPRPVQHGADRGAQGAFLGGIWPRLVRRRGQSPNPRRRSCSAFIAGSMEYGSDHTERATLDFNEPIAGLQGSAFRVNVMGDTRKSPTATTPAMPAGGSPLRWRSASARPRA